MKNVVKFFAVALAISLMAGVAQATPTELLTNGDFQFTNFAAWVPISATLQNESGNYFARLATPYWESQVIQDAPTALAADTDYTFSFSARAPSGYCMGSFTLDIMDAGVTGYVQAGVFDIYSAPDAGWTNYSYTLTAATIAAHTWVADGCKFRVRLMDYGTGTNPLDIDNVSLLATPEPATLAILGLGSLIFARKK